MSEAAEWETAPRAPVDVSAQAATFGRVNYEPLLHIVLHQPEIPQNTGNIGRTCVALGAKLWLVRPLGFRLDERSLKRAGLDYWRHLDWQAVDHWPALCEQLDPAQMWFFTKFAERNYTSASFERGSVLVFGSETSGLPPTIREAFEARCLRIPCRDDVRSLNLSVSAAVAGYEAARQIALA